ncbi:hypothetical protein [Gordonia soli]|uniref:Secreted protein n=1 Tax=Gordonia soli NBRC 108243 TaxID=1223545 RepID=M0QDR1_9ACTN|nr:hypothetical protein [Gordonia soli]GAC66451.1 hypothetical protein GS4_02_01620 [Gordonia soli NBRC 108243]
MSSTSPFSPTSRLRRRLRASVVGVVIGAAAAFGLPATASAEPVAPTTITWPAIPFDSELAAAVRMLKAAGVDKMALSAAQAIIGSAGQLSSQQVAAKVPGVPVAQSDPLAILKLLGIQPLTPSVAPFCQAPTPDNPLGLVTAGAGAVRGPWPLAKEPALPFPIPGVTLPKLNLVDNGETAYAFVPATTAGSGTTDPGSVRVAWFNTTTLQGGFADLAPVAKGPVTAALPLLSNIRLAPVKTGNGTVLSAVFGSVNNGNRSCFFLPAVGIVNA